MESNRSSYHQIIKATSLFGGLQFFKIIISIVRSKFVAALLGPSGIGLLGLFNETINLVSGVTNLGLGTSAVKDISAANANEQKVNRVILVFRRLIWMTGCVGALLMLLFSSLLSELTFGNDNYTISFIWLSSAVLLNQLSIGQLTILQGLRRLKHLAKANLVGSLLGLFISIPLYYIWGINAIIPAIVITSLLSLFTSPFFVKKNSFMAIKIGWKDIWLEGKSMFIMGFTISLVGLATLGASYALRVFISNTGGIEQLGLYNAGFAIINNYVGLVFIAMSTDYYPRLAAVSDSDEECSKLVNQQAEIALLFLAPVITIFMVFIQWIVIILYSDKFISMNEMMYWAIVGVFFKALSWAVAYLMLAKSANRLFLYSELFAITYTLIFNLLGYKIFGITGLGISFFIVYCLYLVQVYLITKLKYNFSFSSEFSLIAIVQMFLIIGCFVVIKWFLSPYSYGIGTLLVMVSVLYSYKELDKRIDIRLLLTSLIGKRDKI